MARTNIFNLLTISNSLEKEYERIRRLTEDEWIVGFCENRDIPKYFSLYEYVEDHGFNNWKNKQFCIDFEDYVDTINLSNIEKEAQRYFRINKRRRSIIYCYYRRWIKNDINTSISEIFVR